MSTPSLRELQKIIRERWISKRPKESTNQNLQRQREPGVGGGGFKAINANTLRVEFGCFFLEPLVHQASDVMHFIGHNYQGCY